jgi:hypothetical protein
MPSQGSIHEKMTELEFLYQLRDAAPEAVQRTKEKPLFDVAMRSHCANSGCAFLNFPDKNPEVAILGFCSKISSSQYSFFKLGLHGKIRSGLAGEVIATFTSG